ncbi:unannotated protein [freshwater metagenome]|uniref:Unannotated protein n=1 Tax=freshwater metagenome TaxID=449393 RepID=A0A6J7UQF2_9ZZZZ
MTDPSAAPPAEKLSNPGLRDVNQAAMMIEMT